MPKHAWLLLLLGVVLTAPARAAEPPGYASFALIIGVNRSVDRDATPLRYADDDAARYLDLFRTLGARSYVLARLDENTRRLHPQVAAEAQLPRQREYKRAIEQLTADVAQARKRGVKTILYFVYAGHGNVEQGSGYITLEDARLHGSQLESEMLARIKPDQEHLIVDACYSYFLAVGRGPGGARREARGFSQLGGLAARPTTGLLFSTSSAKESHEWAGFQAGVFSHEMRSGLYGAADANGDGRVSYREIAAFIQQANASVKNERFRPDVYVRPPKNTDVLVDLSARRGARIEFRGLPGEHHLLEDERGVRYADIHHHSAGAAYLLRPRSEGRLYLRRVSDQSELVVPLVPAIVALAELQPGEGRIASRGAANDAFESLFALPFHQRVVDDFRFPSPPPLADAGAPSRRATSLRVYATIGSFAVAALGVGAGVYGLLRANEQKRALGVEASQAEVASTNDRISTSNVITAVGFSAAGAGAAAGLTLLFWPREPARVELGLGPDMAGVRGAF